MNQLTQVFVGIKAVKATPMTRGDYNKYRGWTPPEGEDQSVDGYLVEYTDGGAPNVVNHAGYVSWSPKEQFDGGYQAIPEHLSGGLICNYLKEHLSTLIS